MDGSVLGKGRTADVFLYEDNQVFKAYKSFMPMEAIENEYKMSKLAFESKISTPEAIKLLKTEQGDGIVFQKVEGISVLDYLSQKPWRVRKEGKNLAILHTNIHQIKMGNGFDTQKKAVINGINRTQKLSDEEKKRIIAYMEQLQEGDRLCHGDFHPDNVMINNNYWIIDWMTGVKGDPICDVARSKLIMEGGALPKEIPIMRRITIDFFRRILVNTYVKEYKKINKVTSKEIDKWRIPLCAARLNENNPPKEEMYLLSEIKKGIRKLGKQI